MDGENVTTATVPHIFPKKSPSSEDLIALSPKSRSYEPGENNLLSNPSIVFFHKEEPSVNTPLSILNKPFYSSSCENLGNQFLEPFIGTARLSKTSSDTPLNDASVVPQIPPRDYLCHITSKSKNSTEIHPVLQHGEKLSNTHYWLLPGKAQNSKNELRTVKKDDYLNFKEFDKQKKDSQHLNTANAKNKPSSNRNFVGKLLCDGHGTSEDEQSLLDQNDINNAYDNCSIHSSSFEPSQQQSQRHNQVSNNNDNDNDRSTSMKDAKIMIEKVQSDVEGVTFDECQTALSMFQWNVNAAIKYLKVENLFRLALASRNQCKIVLEANDWDLNKAASDLLDLANK